METNNQVSQPLAQSGTDKRPGFKEQNLKSCERYIARLKPGSVAELMKSIEDRLADYALPDDAGCGELLKKALRYARAEWPAMKRVLESGEVEISNNISEQSVRKMKMNLRNASNIDIDPIIITYIIWPYKLHYNGSYS